MSKFIKRFHFDTKEVITIFSLFLLVSLLMFTLGTMIGKGLNETECLVYKSKAGKAKAVSAKHKSELKKEKADKKAKKSGLKKEALKKDEKAAKKDAAKDKKKSASKKSDKKGRGIASTAGKKSKKMSPELAVLFEMPKGRKARKKRARKIASVSDSGKFIIQTNAYNNEADAKRRVKKLSDSGFRAFYSPISIPRRGTWYRVGIGYFKSQSKAKLYGKNLVRKKEISSFIIRKVSQ